MNELTLQHMIEVLQTIGVKPGDGLLVHSALQYLGRPVGGIGLYLEAITAVLSHTGTVVVPTFNFSFARGEPFDPDTTPSIGMGAFSEYVRQQKGARRTCHPLQSLAIIGHFADDLSGRDTSSAYDPGSAFERMVELGFKILLLGADIDAVSLIHYSEQRLNAPYRYWKVFTGPVKTSNGWQERTYRMYVRDLALDPKLTLHPVRDLLISNGQVQSAQLNYGQVSLIKMTDFVSAVDRFLSNDPYSLMINRP